MSHAHPSRFNLGRFPHALCVAVLVALLSTLPAVGALAAPGEPTPAASVYLLGPGDKLTVIVLTQPESERPHAHDILTFSDVLVRPDGLVELPLAGTIQASGQTPAALSQLIAERFRRYYRSPMVTVNLSAPRTTISVTGMVRAGGTFPVFEERVPFLKALAMGQGLVESADIHHVQLIRARERGGVVQVDLEKASRDGSIAGLVLEPGDAIYVPPRGRWDFDLPTIVGMVGTIASVITTILLITLRR